MTPGAAVVCGACRNRARSATAAERAADGLPVGDMPGPWVADGLCAQTDPELFYPDKGGRSEEAKAICGRCPVIDPCREWALSTHEAFGVWGGLSASDRRILIEERRRVDEDVAS